MMQIHKFTAAAILAFGVSASAQAASLPPSAIVDQLSAEGYDLRAIICHSGACEVAVHETGDGISRILVNAVTGKPVKNALLGHSSAPVMAGGLSGRDAVKTVAKAGYGDLVSMTFAGGLYEVKARASSGTAGVFIVDASTGALVQGAN